MKQQRSRIPQSKRPIATGSKQLCAEVNNNAIKLGAAFTLHQQGQIDQAEVIYQEILETQPQHFDALQLMATIAAHRKNSVVAVELFDKALKINPNHAGSLNNRGTALLDLKRLDEALDSYDCALKIKPDFVEALSSRGDVLLGLKRPGQALDSYDRVLILKPDNAEVLNNRGNALFDLEFPEQALDSYDRALTLKPDYAEAFLNRGKALRDLQRHQEALDSYDRALTFKPDYVEALNNRGNALVGLKRPDQALDSYDRALTLKPDNAEVLNNRGNALLGLKRPEQALDSYDRALMLNPDNAEVLNNRGNVLRDLKLPGQALDSYDRALTLKPDYAEAFLNRGKVLHDLRRHQEALDSYDRALTLKPDYVEALNNRGNALRDLQRHQESLESYDRALMIEPDYEFLYGTWLHAKMKVCNWYDIGNQFAQLVGKVERDETASLPFPILAISSSLTLQRKAAETCVQAKYPFNNALPKISKPPKHNKIRIGYFSADFHNHATAYLMAEMFELHDKSKFDLIAFSFGPNAKDEMRRRVATAFDDFIDVRNQSDKEVAVLARNLKIDIAVDLKGFTTDSRAGIFAMRAAPLQVNYLGYPGTMGAEYIDYLIADSTLIPESHHKDYSEKIVYLPNSYQVNDAKRRIAGKEFTRAELGLPQIGFVFCCFNNNYKITPSTFDCWMRILKQVEDSILWLLEDNEKAASNLREEAMLRGVDAERLIFAKRMPLSEHLARHRLADLFLDTLPYNAHTTASDALWAGLPVLTCLGDAFAGRVAASLLKAIHLPELITATPEAYEAVAIELATNPDKLGVIKRKLNDNRFTTSLFDTQLFTKHIESAYEKMYERYQADLAPEHIYIHD
ncbi:tetratricopeptide repeat protein [Methylobacter sp.]|uniref:tetratricopeptide repeat protein n=1 Tax=Methylobacter sp. TaxID=2051955 RepID=UPI0024896711|nr:tetratricopeptide repeat protein [Methylobacter sp.]MDI1277300.1 tetratricopeptide repeat protein [Methylobacter sp.]MDI1357908.1 tetratricopeptide repeat protein [Methylobacter sp.]